MTSSMPELLRRLPFVGPVPLATREWLAHARPEPMAYRLLAWDPVTDRPRPIPRAAGVDDSGLLDIGESGNGRQRLRDLLGAAQGKPRSHRAGWEYSVAGYDFGSAFPLETLRVELLHVDSKPLAEALELALLEDYRWRFKDRPPLNGSTGKINKTVAWLQSLGDRPHDDQGWLNLQPLLGSLRA